MARTRKKPETVKKEESGEMVETVTQEINRDFFENEKNHYKNEIINLCKNFPGLKVNIGNILSIMENIYKSVFSSVVPEEWENTEKMEIYRYIVYCCSNYHEMEKRIENWKE